MVAQLQHVAAACGGSRKTMRVGANASCTRRNAGISAWYARNTNRILTHVLRYEVHHDY